MSSQVVGTAGTTRDKLIDAATRLFAEHGVFHVSLAEIVRAAGQRNASAVHYHFKDREGILLAVLEPHVRSIQHRRLELLEVARSRPGEGVRSAAEALVRPVTELAVRGWRERAYLRIGLEVSDHSERVGSAVIDLLRQTAGRETFELMAARVAPMPAAIAALRAAACVGLVGRSAAEWARRIDSGGGRARRPVSDEIFVSNLVDMVVGAFTSPVTVAPDRS